MPDTIFALSSGQPPAAIAIVRVSGPDALTVARQLAGSLPEPRTAVLRTVRDTDGEQIDRALVLAFPATSSATGEDLVEFHLHGGRAVVAAMIRTLGGMPGLRLAEPGEFTRRALVNGRIDLAEAEGLADLLEAETEQELRAALRMAEGGVSRTVLRWRSSLVDIAARIEAMIDFDGEDAVEHWADSERDHAIATIADQMQRVVDQPTSELLREGFRVVVAGPPNAGKSSLVNALADREVAIATPIPGTTRDLIEAPITIAGGKVILTDSAGLRGTPADCIESAGIERALASLASADLVLWLGDVDQQPPNSALINAKCDILRTRGLPVSAVTGEGLEALRGLVAERMQARLPMETAPVINQRQQQQIRQSLTALTSIAVQPDHVLVAEFVRQSIAALDDVTGSSGVEDMLDALFSRFCLGK